MSLEAVPDLRLSIPLSSSSWSSSSSSKASRPVSNLSYFTLWKERPWSTSCTTRGPQSLHRLVHFDELALWMRLTFWLCFCLFVTYKNVFLNLLFCHKPKQSKAIVFQIKTVNLPFFVMAKTICRLSFISQSDIVMKEQSQRTVKRFRSMTLLEEQKTEMVFIYNLCTHYSNRGHRSLSQL